MKDQVVGQGLQHARQEIEDLGGVRAFKSGEWLLKLIQKSLRTPDFVPEYASADPDAVCRRLSHAAAKKTALAGALVGTAVSADELVALFTAGEAGIGIPANIAIAATAICAEVFFVTRTQLQLIAQIATVHGTPLDPNNPEDILTIFSFVAGGDTSAGEGGQPFTHAEIHKHLTGELLERLKQIAKKIGYKLLKRSIVRASVPFASILLSASSNYRGTKSIGKAANRHFLEQRRQKLAPSLNKSVRTGSD